MPTSTVYDGELLTLNPMRPNSSTQAVPLPTRSWESSHRAGIPRASPQNDDETGLLFSRERTSYSNIVCWFKRRMNDTAMIRREGTQQMMHSGQLFIRWNKCALQTLASP